MYSRPYLIWYDVNRVTQRDADCLRAAHPLGAVIGAYLDREGTPPTGLIGESYPTPQQLFYWAPQEST